MIAQHETMRRGVSVLPEGEACPQCGSRMREMLRAQEKSSVFVWYECALAKCAGRILKQYHTGR